MKDVLRLCRMIRSAGRIDADEYVACLVGILLKHRGSCYVGPRHYDAFRRMLSRVKSAA
jgi:hypothetical protein